VLELGKAALERIVRPESRGQMRYLRYADDFVIGFEKEEDARACFERLPERLGKFGLTLAADKSGIIRFDRRGGRTNKRFVFLGSTSTGVARGKGSRRCADGRRGRSSPGRWPT
jgi:hypothetical protein